MDQDLHSHSTNNVDYPLVYPQELQSFGNASSSYLLHSEISPPRFHGSDAFGTLPRHEQHEAEHVYNSPPLALDPSTLNLRSNSNDLASPSSANPSGSNSSTPTGTVRLSSYNLPNSLSPSGVTTRRRARAALEQLQVHIEVGVHPEAGSEVQSQHPPQQSDMQDVRMQSNGDMQPPIGGHHNSNFNSHPSSTMDHEQGQGGATPHPQDIYSLLPGNNAQPSYYIASNSDGFSNSPISPPSPPESSREMSLHPSPTSGLEPPASASASIARSFRSGSLQLGLHPNRLSLIQTSSNHASPTQPQLSPPHAHPQHLSAHPHMHPTQYYPLQHHSAASPGFPSTPTTSHHTQGSSSSSLSSGHTRYSFRGSPGPRSFGSRHARSSSFGTVSTMSVRSSSPANSVASAFTSLSGGGSGSGPASTAGPAGSPTSYAESATEVGLPFSNTSLPSRAQSHPPLSMPTAHPALAPYPALLHPQHKSVLPSGASGYPSLTGEHLPEAHRDAVPWPRPSDDYQPLSGPRAIEDEFQAQYRPKPVIPRAPHRKQKLANSDRKAICMYAKQHPNARQEDIAARYNVERSTISKILKNKERWLGCPDDEAKIARKRKPRFDDLELVLKVWVEQTRDQGIILSDALIRSKAKEEARQLGISEEKFKASSGWLENFKHRVGIRKGKYVGREQWVGASDSENEEQRLSQEELHKQRVVFMTDSSPGYERAPKSFWRMPTHETQRREQAQAMHQLEQSHVPVGDITPGQGSAHSDTTSRSCTDEQPSGVGMRKTRSRTLAEAREAALAGGAPTSPTALTPSTGVLAPAAVITSSADNLSDFSQPPSATSQSPSSATLPDGREASAGLDVALDFIGCQPEGFATPEEVALLQKLSRRMSRTDTLPHSNPSGATWNSAGVN